jgi:hypothetical protein
MKKFLAVFDGYHFSSATMRYSIQLAQEANAELVGVFLDESSYRSFNIGTVLVTEKDPDKKIRALEEKDRLRREEAVRQFQKGCGKAAIRYSVHRDKGIAIQELIQETMFADLLIIDKHESFSRRREKPPTHFVRQLLASLQCPAVLVPATYQPIDKIVLLYDGQPSSTYAFRQFSYLLGNLGNIPVEIVTAKDNFLSTTRLPHNKLIREWMKKHFPKANFTVLKGEAEKQITGHLRNHKENELVVLGAYRRGEVSRWFRASMADVLMQKLETPLFIAHNK